MIGFKHRNIIGQGRRLLTSLAVAASMSIAGLAPALAEDSSTTTLSTSFNPSAYGDSVAFTANVTATTLPTGTVTFDAEGSTIGTGTLAPAATGRTLATGIYQNCEVISNVDVACWGYNGSNQFGDGSPSDVSAPQIVSALASGVTSVSSV